MMIEEKPDFVIHCGDLFHQYRPSPGALRIAIQILDKFKQANIPFYVIRGNHDASKAQAQRFGGTVLKFLEDLGYLKYVQDETVEINEHIHFTGIGEYGKTTGNVVENVLRNNPLDKSKFNILALHGYLQGQVSDSIFDVSGYQLASIGFNYIALGHYHKVWLEAENNIYCPGSTEQTSINDWGKPEKDGFIRKSGYFSIKATLDFERDSWELKVERKEFDIRPKGRFIFNFSDDLSIDELMDKVNSFVKKHDLDGAIIRYDFIGELPLGKQNLINFTKLSALKESKALHIITNQQISNIVLRKAKVGLTSEEALIELLEKSYNVKKSSLNNWLDITNETIKALGQKNISSDEADEVKLIYSLISEISSQLTELDVKKIAEIKIRKKETKTQPVKRITGKKETKFTPKDLKESNNATKQADLELFFKEGD